MSLSLGTGPSDRGKRPSYFGRREKKKNGIGKGAEIPFSHWEEEGEDAGVLEEGGEEGEEEEGEEEAEHRTPIQGSAETAMSWQMSPIWTRRPSDEEQG